MLETTFQKSPEVADKTIRKPDIPSRPHKKAARKQRPVRRNSHRKMSTAPKKDASGPVDDANGAQKPTLSQDRLFVELIRRASGGNKQCIARLREILDSQPEIWQRAGDLGLMAQRSWIDLISGDNALAEESIRRKVEQIKRDLAGNSPTPLEGLLVDLIGVTWLAAFHGEAAAADAGGSVQQVTLRLRRAEAAQRRFLRAIKTLGTFRDLMQRASQQGGAGVER